MHTGVISFCDRVCYNIKSSDTKETILADLKARFNVHVLQKHWLRMDDAGVEQVRGSPHMACLRSNGNPYLLFFTRYDDVAIMYFVDKKIQPGYHVPRVILGRGMWSDALFDGTLMDGEMVRDVHGGWVFLINDMMGLMGKRLAKLTLPQRLELLYDVLSNHYTPDDTLDVCKFHVKRYTHATKQGVRDLLEFCECLPYTNRGLYFWPHTLSLKPKLHNFDDSLIKSVSRKVKDVPDFREHTAAGAETCVEQAQAQPTSGPMRSTQPVELAEGERLLWLRATEHPDVYDVCDGALPSSPRLGPALVNTLAISKMLRAAFRSASAITSVCFVCVYMDVFQKWLPLRRA